MSTEAAGTAAAPSADDGGESPAGTTVVVGAAQGIGAGIARRLAAETWTTRLVLADIKLDGARALAGELAGDEAEVEAIAVDVTDGASVDELVAATAEAERVVIAAGLFAPAPALEVGREEFARIFEVNTEGVFFVAQAYARMMAERGHGAIVGVASIAARMPRMRQTSYCSSKAGMRQAPAGARDGGRAARSAGEHGLAWGHRHADDAGAGRRPQLGRRPRAGLDRGDAPADPQRPGRPA